jgi:hypothetical protein
VGAVLEDGLAGLLGIHEGRGIDVHHHLVSFSRGAGIEAVVQGRRREQRQRVRLLLGHRGRVRGNAPRGGARVLGPPPLLVQPLARRGQRLHE